MTPTHKENRKIPVISSVLPAPYIDYAFICHKQIPNTKVQKCLALHAAHYEYGNLMMTIPIQAVDREVNTSDLYNNYHQDLYGSRSLLKTNCFTSGNARRNLPR